MEAIWQEFQGDGFITLGLDIWNGNPTKLAIFREVTEVSFPLLLRASQVGQRYKSTIDILGVIDQTGRVLWQGHVSQTDLARNMIAELLAPAVPIIRTDTDEIVFGSVEIGNAVTIPLTLQNDGESDLVISNIEPTSPTVEVNADRLTLPPGATRTIEVTFRPESNAEPGRLLIFSNDPNAGRATVTLSGQGFPPAPADPRADFDNFGVVDFTDFLAFADAFGSTESPFDIDASGRVDFGDFLVLTSSFDKAIED